MKGLLITNDFPPMGGGEAVWYDRLCGAVDPDQVIVLAPRLPADAEIDARRPYRVVRVPVPVATHPLARATQMILFFACALRLLRRERVQVVHFGHLYLGLIGLALWRLRKVPYVLYLHGGEMASYLRLRPVRAVVAAVLGGAAAIVVNSSYTRRHYEAIGLPLSGVRTLTMGVDLARFRPGLDPSGIRARYGLDRARVLLTVGRLVERKGHDTVIRALARVRAAIGPVRYLIVGTGPEYDRLRILADEVGCGDDVIFAGRVPDDDLPYLYAAADVFVMPSRALAGRDGIEGFGIVFQEAAACARPAVGARTGGIADAVADGETGVLVAPGSVEELAAAVLELLTDRERAAHLGGEARRRAERLARDWAPSVTALWSQRWADRVERDTVHAG